MKVVFTSDWHLRSDPYPNWKAPSSQQAQLKFFDFLADLGGVVVIAGDVFHRSTAPLWYVNWLAEQINRRGLKLMAIAGNHDLPAGNTSDVKRTAYWALGLMLPDSLFTRFVEHPVLPGVVLHLFNYGVEVPRDIYDRVLVMHRPVFLREVPFWSKDGAIAKDVAEQFPDVSLIVTGDIHTPFMTGEYYWDTALTRVEDIYSGHYLVNPGGVFPEKPGEKKFVYVLEDGVLEQVEIPDFGVQWVYEDTGGGDGEIVSVQFLEKMKEAAQSRERVDVRQLLRAALGEDDFQYLMGLVENNGGAK